MPRLAVVNQNYVCGLGRRMMTIYDAHTGKIRWTKKRLPLNTRVFGTDSLVFIVPPQTNQTEVLKASDGSPVNLKNLGSLITNTMRILPAGLVIAEQKTTATLFARSNEKTIFRLHDIPGNRDLWKVEYPKDVDYSLMADNYIAVLQTSGQVDLIELETGRVLNYPGITEEDLKSKTEAIPLSDHDNFYLMINKKRTGSSYSSYYYGGMTSIASNGVMLAWNRRTGKFLWRQNITNQRLLLQHFTHSPLLVFNVQTYDRSIKNYSFPLSNTWAIDKFTGKVVADISAPNSYSNISSYRLSLGQGTLEMRSYRMRLRLAAHFPAQAEKRTPRASEAPSSPASAEKPVPISAQGTDNSPVPAVAESPPS